MYSDEILIKTGGKSIVSPIWPDNNQEVKFSYKNIRIEEMQSDSAVV